MLRRESPMDAPITIITLISGLVLMSLYLGCCWYLLDKRPREVWQAKRELQRHTRSRITDDEARVWLAMRNAHQRGYWYEKAPAHE